MKKIFYLLKESYSMKNLIMTYLSLTSAYGALTFIKGIVNGAMTNNILDIIQFILLFFLAAILIYWLTENYKNNKQKQ